MLLVTIIFSMIIKDNKNKTLSIEQNVNTIRPYFSNLVNFLIIGGEWNINSSIATNFLCYKDINETRSMHSKNNNEESMIGNKANEITLDLFDSLRQKDQNGSEESMKGSEPISFW